MANATSQSQVHSTRPLRREERSRLQSWDEMDRCVCCGSGVHVLREARFGHIPFCRSCLDRSLHPGIWDDFGEAGD